MLAAKQVPLGCTLGCAAKRSGGFTAKPWRRDCYSRADVGIRPYTRFLIHALAQKEQRLRALLFFYIMSL